MSRLEQALLLVKRAPRLDFHGASDRVYRFIERRAKAFGVGEIRFVDDTAGVDGDLVIAVNAVNPFTDYAVVNQLVSALEETTASSATARGCIPGTQVDVVRRGREGRSIVRTVTTQDQHNNQLNLYKFKRLKMFLALDDKHPDLAERDIPSLMSLFEAEHAFLAGYASGAEQRIHRVCPHCRSTALVELHGRASQPLIGFVRSTIPLYKQCEDCGLGFMTPQVLATQTERLYDEYDYRDSGTEAADMVAPALSEKLTIAVSMLEAHCGDRSLVTLDLGGGTGTFSYHLKRRHADWTVTHSDFDQRRQSFLAEAGVSTRTLNFVTDDLGSGFDLISAFEVIEHVDIDAFEAMVQRVRSALAVGGFFLLSTPDLDSPLIRAFDFFNAYAPHHLLLFGRAWLTRYFSDQSRGFTRLDARAGGDLLQDAASYFSYYASTSPTFQQQASAEVLRRLLAKREARDQLLAEDCGSEVIMLLQRTS